MNNLSINNATSNNNTIGPPTKNIEIGSGGDSIAPTNNATNQIIPLFSIKLDLLIILVLNSNNVTKGVWKLITDPKKSPITNPNHDCNCQVLVKPTLLASFARKSRSMGISML